MPMFARVTRFDDKPASLDAAVDQFKHELGPAAKKLPGFLQAFLMIDRESGRGMAITLWDGEESLKAAEETAAKLRSAATRAQSQAGLTLWAVERYEVADVR